MVITYVVTSWTRIYNDTDRDAQSGSRSSCGRQQRLAFAAWLLHTNLAKALKCQTLWKMLGSLETKTRWQSCWWTSIGTRIACSSVYIYIHVECSLAPVLFFQLSMVFSIGAIFLETWLASCPCWLPQEKFINTVEVIIRKKSAITVWVDEEWLTEKEMKERGWTATLVCNNMEP